VTTILSFIEEKFVDANPDSPKQIKEGICFAYTLPNKEIVKMQITEVDEIAQSVVAEHKSVQVQLTFEEVNRLLNGFQEPVSSELQDSITDSSVVSTSDSVLQQYLKDHSSRLNLYAKSVDSGAGADLRDSLPKLPLDDTYLLDEMTNLKNYEKLLGERILGSASLQGTIPSHLSYIHSIVKSKFPGKSVPDIIHTIREACEYMLDPIQCRLLIAGRFANIKLHSFMHLDSDMLIPNVLVTVKDLESKNNTVTQLDWKSVENVEQLVIVLGNISKACEPLFGKTFSYNLLQFVISVIAYKTKHPFFIIKKYVDAAFFSMHMNYENYECTSDKQNFVFLNWNPKKIGAYNSGILNTP
jgi:hypothetical protein